MNAGEYQLVGLTDDLTQVSNVADTADFIQFQFDEAKSPYEQIYNYEAEIPLIVSNITKQIKCANERRNPLLDLIAGPAGSKVEMLEFKLATAEENKKIVDGFREKGVDTVISYYNFEETPGEAELQKQITNCSRFGDVAKIVVSAERETDALLLLQCLNTASRQGIDVAGYARGNIGKHTRIISVFYGAQMAYAPIAGYEGCSSTEEIDLLVLDDLLDTIINSESATLIDELDGKL